MNIKPIRGQIVVLPDPPVTHIGLIIVPQVATTDNPNYFPETGRIVALAEHSVSEDGDDRPFDVQVGDRVHFNRYAGKQVVCDDDDTRYLVMTERDIVAIVDDEEILHGYQAPADAGIQSYDRDPFADR